MASFVGNEEAVWQLIRAGADLDAKISGTLDTPLHLASEGGFRTTVAILLRADTKTSARNKDGHTPLDLVPSQQKQDFKGLLSNVSSRFSLPGSSPIFCLELFAIHDEVFTRDKHGQTPLHRAAASGNKNKIIQLLSKGIDVNVPDYAGWTPVHEAALHGETEILQLLIEVATFSPRSPSFSSVLIPNTITNSMAEMSMSRD